MPSPFCRRLSLRIFSVPSAPLALSTDASQVCLGASLDQWVDGAWRPLGFWSRPEQQKYSTYRRELLAIKFAIRHFIDLINGRSLTVFTDHRPILGSWKNTNLQAHDSVALNAINEIAQWTNIQYKPGKDLIVPDLLSRPFGVAKAYQVKSEQKWHLQKSASDYGLKWPLSTLKCCELPKISIFKSHFTRNARAIRSWLLEMPHLN